jgi:hypothetical protein
MEVCFPAFTQHNATQRTQSNVLGEQRCRVVNAHSWATQRVNALKVFRLVDYPAEAHYCDVEQVQDNEARRLCDADPSIDDASKHAQGGDEKQGNVAEKRASFELERLYQHD